MVQSTPSPSASTIHTRYLGLQPYLPVLEAMRAFTDARTPETPDEYWAIEHEPVFTQGQAGKAEHILNAHGIPVVQSCRGGQVTYHGPGQLTLYTLMDLDRLGLSTRSWVTHLEQAMISCLAHYGITAKCRDKAPGVYVDEQKIGSVGLRVRHGRCYHGLSFNINMDLSPFEYINPCGYTGLKMTQVAHWVPSITVSEVIPILIGELKQ